jgi:large subunit ribosomal protein L30
MSEHDSERKCILAVRIRGTVSATKEARDTLKMLHLTKNNYAVLIDNRPSYAGMISTVRDYVTYGELSEESVSALIKTRGRLLGRKKLTDEYAKKTGHNSLEELTKAVSKCEVEYWKLPGITPFFRLHPPSKGFKGKIKQGFRAGGELGYRGEKINQLMNRMI